jgi:hypothetical protein
MGRYQYQQGFREQFVHMLKLRNAPKCSMCFRAQPPNQDFAHCPRCDWLLCPHCQAIHKPERHDWKEGDPTNLKKCEMCSVPTDDLVPCSGCLYMLCPSCRSLHKPEQHKSRGAGVVALTQQHMKEISQRVVARVGNPPHGEPPDALGRFEPDCPDCQKWHEQFSHFWPEEMKGYMEEQKTVWKARYKEIMNDLSITEEEIGGPL